MPDTDGDGYFNPDGTWTVNNGADAFPSVPTQWADRIYDGYGDNAVGVQPDACMATAGNSTGDRFGCLDTDGDGFSDPDGRGPRPTAPMLAHAFRAPRPKTATGVPIGTVMATLIRTVRGAPATAQMPS